MTTENSESPVHPGGISVELAIELTTNWRTYLSSANGDFALQSFWVNIESVKSLLQYNPNADGLRFYMGLGDPTDPTSVKIVLVSTEDEKDVLVLENGKSNAIDDLSPCPPMCPTGSPLNG